MALFDKGDIVKGINGITPCDWVVVDNTFVNGYVIRNKFNYVCIAKGKDLKLVKRARKINYKTERWLNPPTSPSTGSIVCYDGDYPITGEEEKRHIFVEISDCHNKIRLHKMEKETPIDFKKKIEVLITELSKFHTHLSENS